MHMSDLVSMISADGVTGFLSAILGITVFQLFVSLRERRLRRWELEDRRAKEAAAAQRHAEKEAERKREQAEARPKALRGAFNLAVAAERSWIDPPGYEHEAACAEEYHDQLEAWQRYDRDFLEPLYNAVRNLRKHGFTPRVGARRRWEKREELTRLVSELEKVTIGPVE